MKSITIHNLENDLANKIQAMAKQKGLSQNKMIKALLRKILNLEDESVSHRKAYFNDLFGTLSKKEAENFFKETSDLNSIDHSHW